MALDTFQQSAGSSMTPSDNCFAITPDDVAELPFITKGIYVGSGGDIVVLTASSQTPVTFRNVLAGCVLDLRVRVVKSTGTTAADLVGLA